MVPEDGLEPSQPLGRGILSMLLISFLITRTISLSLASPIRIVGALAGY